MTKLLLILIVVALLGGCVFQDPMGPTEGQQGQPLQEYSGKDSEGNPDGMMERLGRSSDYSIANPATDRGTVTLLNRGSATHPLRDLLSVCLSRKRGLLTDLKAKKGSPMEVRAHLDHVRYRSPGVASLAGDSA